MEKEKLIDKAKNFAIDVINLCETAKEKKCKTVLVNQIIRSATSIGANISEAKYAQSRNDFVSKLEIALKETYETEYWLDIMHRGGCINKEECKRALSEAGTIRRMLIQSCKTAKEKP